MPCISPWPARIAQAPHSRAVRVSPSEMPTTIQRSGMAGIQHNSVKQGACLSAPLQGFQKWNSRAKMLEKPILKPIPTGEVKACFVGFRCARIFRCTTLFFLVKTMICGRFCNEIMRLSVCECSSMAERQLPKLHIRVRFPSLAHFSVIFIAERNPKCVSALGVVA